MATQIIDDAPRTGGKKSGIGDILKPLNSNMEKLLPVGEQLLLWVSPWLSLLYSWLLF